MWIKYAAQPISTDGYVDVEQPPAFDLHCYTKPRGCWITDDSEDCWRSWSIAERFRLEDLRCKHEVVLDESNILILRDAAALDSFTDEFGKDDGSIPGSGFRHTLMAWTRVAQRWDGLIITPYQWSCRLRLDWYYGWDCASGCIWKASAIREIRLLEIDDEIAKQESRSKFLGVSGEDAA